jgi:hypothetical protein
LSAFNLRLETLQAPSKEGIAKRDWRTLMRAKEKNFKELLRQRWQQDISLIAKRLNC